MATYKVTDKEGTHNLIVEHVNDEMDSDFIKMLADEYRDRSVSATAFEFADVLNSFGFVADVEDFDSDYEFNFV